MQILNVRPGTSTGAETGFDKRLHQSGPTKRSSQIFFYFPFTGHESHDSREISW